MAEEVTSPESKEVDAPKDTETKVDTEIKTPEEDTEGLGLQTEDEIAKAMGIFEETKDDEDNEEKPKTEEPSEKKEAQEEEAKAETDGEEAKVETPPEEPKTEEPKKPEGNPELAVAKAELEIANKRYAESTNEFQTKYKPMEENLKKLESEREELAEVISSNPELAALFMETVKKRELIPKPAQTPTTDAVKEEVLASVRQELAPIFAKQEEEKAAQEKSRYDAILEFEKEHPGLTDEDRGKLGTTERFFRDTFGLPQKEALDKAWTTHFPEKAQQAAAEQAKSETLAKTTTNAKATTQKVSGQSTQPVGGGLSPEQLRMAKKFGISPEQYASALPKE